MAICKSSPSKVRRGALNGVDVVGTRSRDGGGFRWRWAISVGLLVNVAEPTSNSRVDGQITNINTMSAAPDLPFY